MAGISRYNSNLFPNVLLLSYPGSGNTWVRLTIENVTGTLRGDGSRNEHSHIVSALSRTPLVLPLALALTRVADSSTCVL
jgi:hypothetical protein